MVAKKGVIKEVPEDMELEKLMQQLNMDNHNKHPIALQIIAAVRLTMRVKRRTKKPSGKDGCRKSRGQYVSHLQLRNCPLMYIFEV
jgi:hypothetical protein